MKNALLIIALSLAYNLSVLNAQDLAVNNLVPSFEVESLMLNLDKTTHDFGEIPQGTPVKAAFTLTNNSKDILLITEVKTSCGCTVAGHSQDPILPGESTVINVTYNAKKEGQINKTIKVFSNQSDSFIPLKLKGKVIK